MSALVFLDIETTGLSLDGDIWEVAAIRREPHGTETEHHLFVEHDENLCGQLPETFRVDHDLRYDDDRAYSPAFVAGYLRQVFASTADGARPHVVGAVPNFDTERIAILMRRHEIEPTWHHHLIDVEALMVGALAARGVASPLPWRSDDLAAQFGVSIREEDRHTALGDARWARDIYDAVMRGVR